MIYQTYFSFNCQIDDFRTPKVRTVCDTCFFNFLQGVSNGTSELWKEISPKRGLIADFRFHELYEHVCQGAHGRSLSMSGTFQSRCRCTDHLVPFDRTIMLSWKIKFRPPTRGFFFWITQSGKNKLFSP